MPVNVHARVGRIVQDSHDRRKRRGFPNNLAVRWAAPYPCRDLEAVLAKPEQHLAGHPQTSKEAEDVPDPALHLVIRILDDLAVLPVDVADR